MKLGLGTVQFGKNYGIANKWGQTNPKSVERILALAARHQVTVLDTAPIYGTSEEILGSLISDQHYSFRIMTKTIPLKKKHITFLDIDKVKKTFQQSLISLKQASIYGVLFHHGNDLLVPGGEKLFEQISTLKANGLIEKIGVSIYTEKEIDLLLSKYPIEIIQLPINVWDQRFLRNGYLRELKKANIEIHARSIFLQGLLLMEPKEIPHYFNPIRAHLQRYQHFLKSQKITALSAALNFVLGLPEIDIALCGVNTVQQFAELLAIISPLQADLFTSFQLKEECYLNPSKWTL